MYEFGPFRADTVRGVLSRDGLTVPLTGKCFEVLVQLLRNAPETMSKDELMKAVWADTFVEESNLTQHISLLRKGLGESPQERLYIATVPGRGYRFVAPVKDVGEPIEEPPIDRVSDRMDGSQGLLDNEPALERDTSLPATTAESLAAFASPRSWLNRKPWIWLFVSAIVLLGGVMFLLVHRVDRVRPVPTLGVRDSVVLEDFENHTGDPVFDGPLREGLAMQLGQSPFLDLVGPESIRETLRLMGRSPDDPVRPPFAREVCERAGAKALISGSIATLGTAYVIGVDAVGCADGRVLAREQAEAKNKEEVLRVLGRVTARLRNSLGESLASVEKFDVPMEQATTRSLEALRTYSLGVDERNRGQEKASIPFFEHALALDPQFAMAFAQLGAAYRNVGQTEQARACFEKAFALRENLSEREKLHLTVRYLETVRGDVDQAIETYEVWSRLYPRDAQPFTGLSARYQVVGQYEKAAAAAREGIDRAPGNYVPYVNLARSYMALNRLDDATRVCRQASEAGRDSIRIHRALYEIAYIQRDEAGMQRAVESARGTEQESDMLDSQAAVLVAAGKLKAGKQLMESVWSTWRSHGLGEEAAYSMAEQALAEADLGKYEMARATAHAALQLGQGVDTQETAAEALALAGDVHQAQDLVNALRQRFPRHSVLIHASLPSTMAAIALQHHQPESAIDMLRQAAPYDLAEFSDLSPIYIRGLAYLRAKSGEAAAAEFQKILDHPGINVTSQRHSLARLGMARASAIMGNPQQSRKNYAEFLASWSGGDTDIPVLQEAKLEFEQSK